MAKADTISVIEAVRLARARQAEQQAGRPILPTEERIIRAAYAWVGWRGGAAWPKCDCKSCDLLRAVRADRKAKEGKHGK